MSHSLDQFGRITTYLWTDSDYPGIAVVNQSRATFKLYLSNFWQIMQLINRITIVWWTFPSEALSTELTANWTRMYSDTWLFDRMPLYYSTLPFSQSLSIVISLRSSLYLCGHLVAVLQRVADTTQYLVTLSWHRASRFWVHLPKPSLNYFERQTIHSIKTLKKACPTCRFIFKSGSNSGTANRLALRG